MGAGGSVADPLNRSPRAQDTDSVVHATTLDFWGDARNNSRMFGDLPVRGRWRDGGAREGLWGHGGRAVEGRALACTTWSLPATHLWHSG